MSKIFICYRRQDTPLPAGILRDLLAERFGDQEVFMDIDNIEPGEDFVEVIQNKVGVCNVLLAVIGTTWVSSADETGHRRLDNPEDFVRLEIATALERNIRVIPVLVGGAKAPKSSELPELLRPLSRRNAIELSDTRFRQDAGRLLDTLAKVLTPRPIAETDVKAEQFSQAAVQPSGKPPPATVSAPPPTAAKASATAGFAIFRDPLEVGCQGPEMIRIPPGQFRMGDLSGKGDSDERPVHGVIIAKPFAIGRYPVTFEEWEVFAQTARRPVPDDRGWDRGRRPVINVSWHDAIAFAAWLSEQTGRRYRLPSESEWEYAARAGTETEYWWGNAIGSNRANGKDSGSEWSGEQTSPVGSFEPNPWGLQDTAGNVWEWVQDVYHTDYQGAPIDGSARETLPAGFTWFGLVPSEKKVEGGRRVIRGGSWGSGPGSLRSAYRNGSFPGDRGSDLGFRLAQDLP